MKQGDLICFIPGMVALILDLLQPVILNLQVELANRELHLILEK